MRVAFTFTVVLVLLSPVAYAASYSLTQAIERAKSQNPERQMLAASRDALLARKTQALAPVQPTFALGFGDLAAQPGPENSGLRTYQLSQALGFPGKAHVSAHSFELDASSVTQEIAAKNVEIVRLVKVAFFQLWLAEQRTVLNDVKRSAFEKILSVAKRRLVKDTTSEVEYLTAETALKKTENEHADIVASERGVRVTLNTLLELSPESPTTVEGPQFSRKEPIGNVTTLREQFLKANPALQALRLKLEAADNRVSEAKWTYLPDFKLSAGMNSFHAYAGIIELSFPLWFWWNEQSGVKAANATLTSEQANYTARERALLSTFEGKLISLELLETKLKNYNAFLVPNSKKAFDVALKNYRYGKIEFATLTSSAESLVGSRLEYDTLLAEYETTRAETEELMGGTLP